MFSDRLWEATKDVSHLWQNQGGFHCSGRRVAVASKSQKEWPTLLWGIFDQWKIPGDCSSLLSKVSSSCCPRLGRLKFVYLSSECDHQQHSFPFTLKRPGLKNKLHDNTIWGFTILSVRMGKVLFFVFCFFCFLGLYLQHMEIPRLEVKSELQLPAYPTATATLDLSGAATYTIAHGNTGSLTNWVRPGI